MGSNKRAAWAMGGSSLPASKKQHLPSPPKESTTEASGPRLFTHDDAVALYRQVKAFEKAYKDEGYKVPDDASEKEIELAMIRGTLNLRIREISLLIFHNFVAYPTPTRSLPASDPIARRLRDYQTSLAFATAAWSKLIGPILRRQQAAAEWRARRARSAKRERTSRDAWWKSAREGAADEKYDADVEELGTARPHSNARSKKKQRAQWYADTKEMMRKYGLRLTTTDHGPVSEWERLDADTCASPLDAAAPGDRVRSDWVIPDHVATGADLFVYLNQLGLRRTPCRRKKQPRVTPAPITLPKPGLWSQKMKSLFMV